MNVKEIGQVRKLTGGESVLEVASAHQQVLEGIAPGDRVQVLYWMHQLEPGLREALKVHPRGDTSRPRKGVLGLRSPIRPNPIGVSVVQVKRVEGNRLLVTGLDALNGSPLIDVKGSCRPAEVKHLVKVWGEMHDTIAGHLEDELGEPRVREMLYQALWELGRRAANERREDADSIGREIMAFEASWDIEGRILKSGPDGFIREVTHCPWSYFGPVSCRLFAWWMEGFCYGLNDQFQYALEKSIPQGGETCVWSVLRRSN